MNTIIASNEKIEGNISKCEFKDVIVRIEKSGAFAWETTDFHQVYNVCTGQVVSEYATPELTFFGFIGSIGLAALVIILVGICVGIFE